MNKIEKLNLKCMKYLIVQTEPDTNLFIEIKNELTEELQKALAPQSGKIGYEDDIKEEKCFECGTTDNLVQSNGEVLCKKCANNFLSKSTQSYPGGKE